MTDPVITAEPKKRPAFQFYPADWRKDVELRSCSVAARGLWMDLLCIAHECEPYGHLTVNGRAMTAQQIAGQVGVALGQCKTLLAELIANGVARQNLDGTIFSKRMVNDERVRNARAEGGKEGAEHGAKGGEHGIKGGRPKAIKGANKTPLDDDLEPPPSSSLSSSSSASPDSEAIASAGSTPAVDPAEAIFALGIPLLTQANVPENNARSFLGFLRKQAKTKGGDMAVLNAINRCAKERALQPVEFLQGCFKAEAVIDTAAERARTTAEAKALVFGNQEYIDG